MSDLGQLRSGTRVAHAGARRPRVGPTGESDEMTGGSPALRKVAAGKLCSGCGACAAVAPHAIAMETSGEGFLRPVQRSEIGRDEERLIRDACPGLGLDLVPTEGEDHPLWGPSIAVRTGHAADPALRRNASSGGALSALLAHLLATGQVDAVLETGADRDLPYGNATVIATSGKDVLAVAGSRYAPSAPLAGLRDHLARHGRLAFVGKPCDVAALRRLQRADPSLVDRIPLAISFFCAGVPSLSGARRILERLGVQEEEVIALRYRGDGWPGMARARLADGSVREMSYQDSWGGILSRAVQPRCRICPDGTGAFADVVCADAWETDAAGYPLFEEADGLSLVVSRTAAGERLVREAMAAGALLARETPVEAIAAMQPGQVGKRRFTPARLLALAAFGRPVPRYRGFHLASNARAAGLLANLRQFAATARGILAGRL